MFEEIAGYIRQMYDTKDSIPLHAPRFIGNEKKYLSECIDTTYVSYVGSFVSRFEEMIRTYTGASYAISTANGTLALHLALLISEVKSGDEVLTPALTFVATTNAISHCSAKPIFVDSERSTLGMSPDKLEAFLEEHAIVADDGYCYNRQSGKRIAACIPVHVFGHPTRIAEICAICARYNITVIEDAAESIGSYYNEKHTGLFGKVAILSFNGNKTITTGGGGVIITDDEAIAERAAHIGTTAKRKHPWEFYHDAVGYNYRMPNINAAVGCAQMESLNVFLENKRRLTERYRDLFSDLSIQFIEEPKNCHSNYWLNAIILEDKKTRDSFLEYTNSNGIMTRPIWALNNKLPMYHGCTRTNLDVAQWLEERIVCIPSSVVEQEL